MSGFSTDWLRLREPVDQRSRNGAILAAVERYFHDSDAVTAIDLASGRGSMIRALMPRLPAWQHWYPIDDEPALLRDAELARAGTIRIESRLVNLADHLEDVLSIAADLIVTSAFIDLVSDPWLDRLVRGAASRPLPVYLGMSYDGHVACSPRHDLDEMVIAAFGRHQQRDKGFGPALGPAAGEAAADKFRRARYDVVAERADWRLERHERELQAMMVAGWCAAVSEMGEMEPSALRAWHDQHQAWITDGQSEMMVGHLDVWATPR